MLRAGWLLHILDTLPSTYQEEEEEEAEEEEGLPYSEVTYCITHGTGRIPCMSACMIQT